MKRIAVVGGGIMGMSSALRLAVSLRLDGIAAVVELFAESLTPNNTSDGAAGLWHPPSTCSSPKEKHQLDWAFATYDWLMLLTRHANSCQIGISQFRGFRLCSQDFAQEDPIWKDKVPTFSFATKKELTKRQFPSDTAGFLYSSMLIQGSRYCPWLLHCLKHYGIAVHQQKVTSFRQFSGHFDLVVNCSGLGAMELCQDYDVEPIRGQIVRVKAPWIKQFFIYNSGQEKLYIVPCVDFVVLGGTKQHGNWDRTVNPEDRKYILDQCYKIEPSLQKAPIVGEWVGLRPGRKSGPRVQLENFTCGDSSIQVVHNYGHGGSGLTYHWGCAEEVTKLAYKALRVLGRKARKNSEIYSSLPKASL